MIMSNLAIIPARGGSKGIPEKNLKLIAGKPLIAWTIEQALNASLLDRVIVSTDSEEISEIALMYGAEVPFKRPSKLSTDESTTEASLIHCVDWLKANEDFDPENIILLQCTSPIRNENSIDQAIIKFKDEKAGSLLSVYEFKRFLWRNQNHPEALYNFNNRPRRQDKESGDLLFFENGSIYITKRHLLTTKKNRLAGKIVFFEMNEIESFEIDTPDDWFIVEALLKQMKKY